LSLACSKKKLEKEKKMNWEEEDVRHGRRRKKRKKWDTAACVGEGDKN
jgi:hypothetical protein